MIVKEMLKVFMVLLSGTMIAGVLLSQDESDGRTVAGGTHASVKFTAQQANSYRVYAYSADNWLFDGSFTMTGPGWYKSADQETIKLGKVDSDGTTLLSAANVFGAFMDGAIKPISGGGAGGQQSFQWSIGINGPNGATFAIVPQYKLVPTGGDTAFSTSPSTTVTWQFSGVNGGTSYTSPNGASGSLPSSASAGQYIVTGTNVNNSQDKAIARLDFIEIALNPNRLKLCAKPEVQEILPYISNSAFFSEITINTTPSGFYDSINLNIDSISPTRSSKGWISKLTVSKWKYDAFFEAKADLNPGGVNREWIVKIKDSFSSKIKSITVKSVFSYFISESKQTEALLYVVWKYNLTGYRIGTYDSSLSDYGKTIGNGSLAVITYGAPCFQFDAENILASNIIHEHLHSTQDQLTRTYGAIDAQLYKLGGNPEPPTLPVAGTEGKEWAEMELPAYYDEWNARAVTGIMYSGYHKLLEDYITFFEFLLHNAD